MVQQILQFARAHLVSLISGVVAIGAIVAMVMGMSAADVTKDMEKRVADTGAGQIAGLKASPRNRQAIDREKEKGRRFQQEFEETVKEALAINQRKELMSGIFPAPEDQVKPFEFRMEYAKAVARLPADLFAGTLPTIADIQEEQQNVEDLLAQEREKREEETGSDASGRVGAPAGRAPVAQPAPSFTVMSEGGRPGIGRGSVDGMMNPAMNIDANTEPKFNPLLRARVSKARSIRCYIDEQTFHVHPLVNPSREAPSVIDMWMAQTTLWIQQDVVAAIARVNKDRAEKPADGEVFVEHVPVKRLISVRVHGYEGERYVGFPSTGATGPSEQRPASFTGRKGDDQFDVLRFTVKVVIDQRQLVPLVNEMSRVNFYRCINIQYEAVPPAHAAEGYLYGTAPCVVATLDFEGYMARAIFDKIMPTSMRTLIGGQKSE